MQKTADFSQIWNKTNEYCIKFGKVNSKTNTFGVEIAD